MPAGATVPDDLDPTALDAEEIAALLDLQRQYDELVADESETLAEYALRIARVEELDAGLASLDAEITRTAEALERAVARVDTLDRRVRVNERAVRRAETDLADARERLQHQAIDAFVFGGSAGAPTLEAVLDARDAHAAGIAMTYADAVLDVQQATIDEVEALEARLAETGVALAVDRADAEEARREVEQLGRQLDEQRSSLEQDREAAEAERAAVESALTTIRDRKAGYDQRLRTMAIESDNITSVLGRAQRGQERADPLPLLRTPVEPFRSSSGFGPRVHPIFGDVRRHNGLDLSGRLGDPIRAVDAGVVVMAEARNGFGNTIVIDHGDRVASLYAHQSRFEVGVGDVVRRGQLIGRIGSTGWSTGPHLHLEVRLEGVPIDPAGLVVREEPLSCELLLASEHPLDRAVLSERDDCGEGLVSR